jgi:hypothetical protein
MYDVPLNCESKTEHFLHFISKSVSQATMANMVNINALPLMKKDFMFQERLQQVSPKEKNLSNLVSTVIRYKQITLQKLPVALTSALPLSLPFYNDFQVSSMTDIRVISAVLHHPDDGEHLQVIYAFQRLCSFCLQLHIHIHFNCCS